MTNAPARVRDTETTLNKDTPEAPLEVIELAYVNVREPTLHTVKRYQPEHPCSWGAMAVHHIIPSDLAGQPPSAQARLDVPPATYWIGHNIEFDWRALGSPPGIRLICTLALSRSLWPKCDSHTLSAISYYLHGANEGTRNRVRAAHAAAADIALCYDLFVAIMQETKMTDLDDLYDLSCEALIPKVMTFGKFAGQPISAVDRGYASWFARQPDADPNVLTAFRRQGLLR